MSLEVLIVYCVAVLLFCITFSLLKVVATAKEILKISSRAIAVVRNSEIDDLEKERQIQALSLRMLREFLTTIFKGFVLVTVSASPALVAASLGFIDLQRLIAFSVRWDVVLVTIVTLTGSAFALRKQYRPDKR